MEREITLSSFSVRNVTGKRLGDFTTRFTPELNLEEDASFYVGFNRIISMFFFLGQMFTQVTRIKK